MKTARFVLKCVALGLTAAAVVCAVVAYWDKLMDLFYTVSEKLEERKAARITVDDEFADFADCDCDGQL